MKRKGRYLTLGQIDHILQKGDNLQPCRVCPLPPTDKVKEPETAYKEILPSAVNEPRKEGGAQSTVGVIAQQQWTTDEGIQVAEERADHTMELHRDKGDRANTNNLEIGARHRSKFKQWFDAFLRVPNSKSFR
jgi:hypothetical protein